MADTFSNVNRGKITAISMIIFSHCDSHSFVFGSCNNFVLDRFTDFYPVLSKAGYTYQQITIVIRMFLSIFQNFRIDTAPCPAQEGGDTIILPHVKDDTDTEYAAKLASEKGFDEALLLGVLGGRRLEHTLANLCTGLGLEQRGVRATLLDERSRITFVMPGETRRYPRNEYFYLSVFPMEGRAEGVSERGSFYELTDAVLTAGYPLGVSNEYADGSDCITISTQKGALVVVETVPDGPILS